jgi:hypothetical protein
MGRFGGDARPSVALLLGDLDQDPDRKEGEDRHLAEDRIEDVRCGSFHLVALLHKLRRLGKHIREGAEHERLIRRPVIVATDQIGRGVDALRHGQPMRVALVLTLEPIVCLAGTRHKNLDGFLHFVLSGYKSRLRLVLPIWASCNASGWNACAAVLTQVAIATYLASSCRIM